MMKMRQVVNYARRWLGDGAFLFATTLKQQKSMNPSSFRELLLLEARKNENSAAKSMLMVDREIGLVKYHGFVTYLAEHSRFSRLQLPFSGIFGMNPKNTLQAGSFSTSSSSAKIAIASNSNTKVNPKKAKVAFMITANQRAQLIETGYTHPQIKKLKPLEALLILEQDLKPPNSEKDHSLFQEQLNKLVKEYEEEQQSQRNMILAQTPPSLDDRNVERPKKEEEEHGKSTETLLKLEMSPKVDRLDTNREKATLNADHKNALDSASSLVREEENENWFEVVEVIQKLDPNHENSKQTPIISIIGLYKSEKEANFCREIKEDAAAKRNVDGKETSEQRIFTVRERKEK